AETEAAIAQLPPATLARLDGIRPARYMDRVTTRLFIMHDRGDHFVPYTESRRLMATTPPDHLARYTELDMFDHVVPNRAPTEVKFYVEAARLLAQLYAILLYVL